ncbi:hypothetical protein L218DRAFT_1081681 [Marasmius fiardii PR-910]|nr:hypothetical protein L218DRAFT_1081681 [Marasmius fiardii PR-910]
MCDVNIQEHTFIETRTFNALAEFPTVLKPTNPFLDRLRRQKGSLKVRKIFQSAQIVQYGGQRFTLVAFEPEHGEDAEKIRKVLRSLCETTLSSRQAWLTQLFGVGRTATPTLIYHDEFVSGWDIIEQHSHKPIVLNYLWFRLWAAVNAVVDYKILQQLGILQMSNSSQDWTFNLRTGSFHYDIASTALFYAEDNSSEYRYIFTRPVFLFLPSCNLLLESNTIISAIPNFLALTSSLAHAFSLECFTDFVRHGVLTFGAVVDRTKPSILGRFPSIPCPEWYCSSNGTSDVDAEYSHSVPSLLNLTFKKETNIQMKLRLSLQQSSEDRELCQTSYMIQSLQFCNYGTEWDDLVFINGVHFVLSGIFMSNWTRSHSPVYLHVPPLSPGWINGMPCLPWTSTNPFFFYWSSDRSGVTRIAEADWESYGIPNLRVETYLGSFWMPPPYHAIQEYLWLKSYDPDGKQFATQHDYPLLIEGDPHVHFETHSPLGTENHVSLIESLKLSGILEVVSGPLHRTVIRVGEVYQRYGKHPAFRVRWYRRSSARSWSVVSRQIKALIRGLV